MRLTFCLAAVAMLLAALGGPVLSAMLLLVAIPIVIAARQPRPEPKPLRVRSGR